MSTTQTSWSDAAYTGRLEITAVLLAYCAWPGAVGVAPDGTLCVRRRPLPSPRWSWATCHNDRVPLAAIMSTSCSAAWVTEQLPSGLRAASPQAASGPVELAVAAANCPVPPGLGGGHVPKAGLDRLDAGLRCLRSTTGRSVSTPSQTAARTARPASTGQHRRRSG